MESTTTANERFTKPESGVAEKLKQQACDATRNISDKVSSAGECISEKASEAMDTVSSAVSKGVEQVQEYVSEERIKGFVNDVKGLINRYPVQTAVAGLGVGFLLSKYLSSKRS